MLDVCTPWPRLGLVGTFFIMFFTVSDLAAVSLKCCYIGGGLPCATPTNTPAGLDLSLSPCSQSITIVCKSRTAGAARAGDCGC